MPGDSESLEHVSEVELGRADSVSELGDGVSEAGDEDPHGMPSLTASQLADRRRDANRTVAAQRFVALLAICTGMWILGGVIATPYDADLAATPPAAMSPIPAVAAEPPPVVDEPPAAVAEPVASSPPPPPVLWWSHHEKANCYDGHGCEDDGDKLPGMNVDACKAKCRETDACEAVVVARTWDECYLKKNVGKVADTVASGTFDLWILHDEPEDETAT